MVTNMVTNIMTNMVTDMVTNIMTNMLTNQEAKAGPPIQLIQTPLILRFKPAVEFYMGVAHPV